MAYPTEGYEGAVTSFGSANFYSVFLSKFRPLEATIDLSKTVEDVTGLGVAAHAALGGLKAWTGNLRGLAFATPAMGNVGNFAFASGYALHVYRWRVQIETVAVHEITALNVGDTLSAGSPKFARFMPSYSRWSGSVECGLDSATQVTEMTDASVVAAAATFTYGATPETLAGDIIIDRHSFRVARANPNRVTMNFTGDGVLTPAGTNSPFGTTAFGVPIWSAGGSAAGAIVVTSSSGQTLSGYDSFWRRITVDCAVNRPVAVEMELVGSGRVTYG